MSASAAGGHAIHIVEADAEAARAVRPVIERAYRGDSARKGWTHEADLLEGERTSEAELVALATSPGTRLLVAWSNESPVGSVALTDCGHGRCYVGLVAIEPDLQATGLGRQLLTAAQSAAKAAFGSTALEMTVISTRTELIAYYQRRGYRLTGERRPFPDPDHPEIEMVVLERLIA